MELSIKAIPLLLWAIGGGLMLLANVIVTLIASKN